MKQTYKRLVLMLSILILVIVVLIGGFQILESTVLLPEQTEQPTATKTITRNGVDYLPRQDITTLLVMGIDEVGPVKDSGSYRNTGESDVLLLMIFDEKNETYTILALNRDTMLDMPVLGIGGKQAGTFFGQLALSHTYGGGLEDSCENTRETISDFLGGVTIDYYVSMNMDAIELLNDAVGGVRVYVTEDFSEVDPSIAMGEMVLNAAQARTYVQIRKDVGNQLNLSRMERHKDYMKGFMEALTEKIDQNDSFILQTYEKLTPYIVTDCSVNTMTSLVERFSDYTMQELVSPEGENVLTNQFYEFYVDEEQLDSLVLRLFYAEK